MVYDTISYEPFYVSTSSLTCTHVLQVVVKKDVFEVRDNMKCQYLCNGAQYRLKL